MIISTILRRIYKRIQSLGKASPRDCFRGVLVHIVLTGLYPMNCLRITIVTCLQSLHHLACHACSLSITFDLNTANFMNPTHEDLNDKYVYGKSTIKMNNIVQFNGSTSQRI